MINKQLTVTDLCVLLELGGWWIVAVLSMAKAWHAENYVNHMLCMILTITL